jgi:hypothetical protein
MNFFNNIYASSYRAYQRYNDGPRLSSVCVVAIIQGELLLLILIVIEKVCDVTYYISKTYSTFPVLLLIILLFKDYSEDRTMEIVERFAQ